MGERRDRTRRDDARAGRLRQIRHAPEAHAHRGALDVAADAEGNAYVLTSTRIIKYAPTATTGVKASWGAVRARYR